MAIDRPKSVPWRESTDAPEASIAGIPIVPGGQGGLSRTSQGSGTSSSNNSGSANLGRPALSLPHIAGISNSFESSMWAPHHLPQQEGVAGLQQLAMRGFPTPAVQGGDQGFEPSIWKQHNLSHQDTEVPRTNICMNLRSIDVLGDHLTVPGEGGGDQSGRSQRNGIGPDDLLASVDCRLTPSTSEVTRDRSSRHRGESKSSCSSDSKAALDWYSAVREELEAARVAHLWHIIYASDGIGTTVDGMDPLLVPAVSTAVIIITDMLSVPASTNAVHRLSKDEGDTPIIVIILLEECEQTPEYMKAVMRASRAYFTAGANDVVMQAGMVPAPWLAISTSLVRIGDRMLAMQKLEKTFESRLEEHQAQRMCAEPNCGMFWSSVQNVFRDIPPMQSEVTTKPQVGAEVGVYSLNLLLGRGSCGEVYAATNRETGETEAIKVIHKDKLNRLKFVEDLRKEIKVLRAFENKHIMSYHSTIHGPEHLFICLEMVGTCNLNRALRIAGGSFHVGAARSCQWQICDGIAYCFLKGVAHRDIKPENIGISDCGSYIKLLDFGSAAPMYTMSADMAGTMPFMAPEVLIEEDTRPYDPSRMDVWSSGVVLLEMLCGWGILNRMLKWQETVAPEKVRAEELEQYFSDSDALRSHLQTELSAVDEGLLLLMQGMLQVDADLRWTSAQCCESLWLQEADRPIDLNR